MQFARLGNRRYTRQDPTGGNGRLTGFDLLPHDRQKSYNLIDTTQALARTQKATVAQIALAWLLAKPQVTSILLGASKTSQLHDNLGVVDLRLSPEEVAQLDEATAPTPIYPNWFQQRTIDVAASNALKNGLPARMSEVRV